MNTIEAIINQAWEKKQLLTGDNHNPFSEAIYEAIKLLNKGKEQIAYKEKNSWQINAWLKKAILLYFKINNCSISESSDKYYDKIPLKFSQWQEKHFIKAGIRIAPNSIVRKGAYLSKDVVTMPCFINIGAHIGERTMIDSYATIASCAQIGKNCHIASGVVIGGVLEPINANPVIIEDDCFIGANSSITEGVLIKQGAVIGSGVSIAGSTPIVEKDTGVIHRGVIPENSVIISGSMPLIGNNLGLHTYCPIIIKKVTPEIRAKLSLNEILRSGD